MPTNQSYTLPPTARILPDTQAQRHHQDFVTQLERQESWVKEFVKKQGEAAALEVVDSTGPAPSSQYTLVADQTTTADSAVLVTEPASAPTSPKQSNSFSGLSDLLRNFSPADPCTPKRSQLADELNNMSLSSADQGVVLDINSYFNLQEPEQANSALPSSRFYGDGLPMLPGRQPKDVLKLWIQNHPDMSIQKIKLSKDLVGIRAILEAETGSTWGKDAVSMGCTDKDLVFYDPSSGNISCAVSPEWREYLRDVNLPPGPLPRLVTGMDFTHDTTGVWWLAHKGLMTHEAMQD